MTNIKKSISVLLIISILISALTLNFSFNVLAAETKGTITVNSLRMRADSNTGSEIITKLSAGAMVIILGEKKGETISDEGKSSDVWYKISYDGKQGYVSSIYVQIIPQYTIDQSFESLLAGFPEDYKPYLRELHAQYPNWKFMPEVIGSTLDEAVAGQIEFGMRKQVPASYTISWRSMGKGAYDWTQKIWETSNGSWVGASREVIRYYLDPRNFLNSSEIYMFLVQSYGDYNYTEAELKTIVSGTFLDTNDYMKIIMSAGKQSGISPYVIASKIIQEQGSKGESQLISGVHGYYNFFNWGASGNTDAEVVANGISTAKSNGWDTKEKSIVGGAKKLSAGYVEVGQDTYYYQDFNVKKPDNLYHQYAQAVYDARSKGYSLRKSYSDKTNLTLIFKIPIYKNMPAKFAEKPASNDNKNNYYFDSISVSGLTPSFSRYTYSYDLHTTGDAMIDVAVPKDASVVSATEFPLKAGNNTVVLTVKAQSGYTTDYKINVNATVPCTIYVNAGLKAGGKGDLNGDGKITASDLATVRLHLLGKYTLSGAVFNSADINGDSKITAADLATIRLHLLGKYKIQ